LPDACNKKEPFGVNGFYIIRFATEERAVLKIRKRAVAPNNYLIFFRPFALTQKDQKVKTPRRAPRALAFP
jgi:hypothetical protein